MLGPLNARSAKKEIFCGGVLPLGYDIVNGQYVINEAEAEIVRIIFSEYSFGASYNAMIEKLHGRPGKFDRPLGKNSLCDILQNERYVGIFTWNKRIMRKWAGGKPNPNVIRIDGIVLPIIDKETWERVRKECLNMTARQPIKRKGNTFFPV